MAMKRRGGTKAKLLLRECWTFLIYIFLHQQWKQCLEFTLAKLREICNIWLVLAIQTVMPVGYTILLLSAKTKQGNQCNEASRLRKCIKKSVALSFAWNAKKSLCKLNSLHCRQKTTTSLWKTGTKRELEKKELRPQANNAQYNTQGWNGGGGGAGWSEKTVGGGGAGGSFTPTYIWAGWNSIFC